MTHPDTPEPTAGLTEIRKRIDALDHELLELMARRDDMVVRIAQSKREAGTAIRDADREREILADRREQATHLGLSADLAESLFRLILFGSRERQACLKAEVPQEMQPRRVAVIGGRGAMGNRMALLFSEMGHEVSVADVDTALTPERAAEASDVVCISVPVESTLEVIGRVGPRVRRGALLMDVTSIKREPVEAMLAATRASVVGTHPLFGPSVHSLQGQRIALVEGRGRAWFEWTRRVLRARGLTVVETTADAHDRSMAIVQVLSHFATEVVGNTMRALGVPLEDTLAFASPVYLMEMLMTARHFAQSPHLYAAIQFSNPRTAEVTEAFVRSAMRLRRVVDHRDGAAFAQEFEHVRGFFGPFTQQALDQSNFLIDRLVERS